MNMKKLALAFMIGGLAWSTLPGYAMADTASNQQFSVVKLGSSPGTVIASGAITGVGIENNNRLQVPPGTPFQVTFRFPEGDVFQTVTPVGPPEIKFNPNNCVSNVTLHVTTVITGGTNALASVAGSGTAATHRTAISGRDANGKCLGPSSPPIFELSVVRATGTATFG